MDSVKRVRRRLLVPHPVSIALITVLNSKSAFLLAENERSNRK
jgi:hypothetical protein